MNSVPAVPAGTRPLWRVLAPHAAALLLCFCAAVIYTFPLVLHLRSMFPATDLDVFAFLWNNWWIHESIVHLHQSPLTTTEILTPVPVDLRLHTLALLNGLLALPFTHWWGQIVVLNLQILLTATLNGYAAFMLTRTVTRRGWPALVSGFLVAWTPAINFHLTRGRPGCATLWPAVFAIRAALRLIERPSASAGAMLGAWLVLSMLADLQATLFCGIWLAALAVWHLASDPRRWLTRGGLAACATVAAIIALPSYYLLWQPIFALAGYTVPGPTEANYYSYPLRIFWRPVIAWRLYGALLPAALIAGLATGRRSVSAWPWLLGGLAFVILSLGPVIMGTEIPMPFQLLRQLPGLTQFRTPSRFQIPAAIALAVGAGVLLTSWSASMSAGRRRAVVVGVLVLAILDLAVFRLIQGFPLRSMSPDPVYGTIARDSRDVVVLEVPVGMRFGTDEIGKGESLTFHQPVHGKRLISGNVSRGPLATLLHYRASPAVTFLAGEVPPPGDIADDLRETIHELSIGYVVVHLDMVAPEKLKPMVDLFSSTARFEPIPSGPTTIAYRVLPERP